MYEYIETRVGQLEDEQPASENVSRAADQLEELTDGAANSLPPKTSRMPPSPADWLSQLRGDFGLARTYWLYGIDIRLALLIIFFLFEDKL